MEDFRFGRQETPRQDPQSHANLRSMMNATARLPPSILPGCCLSHVGEPVWVEGLQSLMPLLCWPINRVHACLAGWQGCGMSLGS